MVEVVCCGNWRSIAVTMLRDELQYLSPKVNEVLYKVRNCARSAVFNKELVTINSQEDKRRFVRKRGIALSINSFDCPCCHLKSAVSGCFKRTVNKTRG